MRGELKQKVSFRNNRTLIPAKISDREEELSSCDEFSRG
jgi:hypothetical protein